MGDMTNMAPMTVQPSDIRLVQTCSAFPEQYDAFIGDKQVGYLRLRWGEFYVQCPKCLGFSDEGIVYEASPDGFGEFTTDERGGYLEEAKQAICDWLNAGGAK